MSVRVAEQVEDWESRSFAGGYEALGRLADGEFSGTVRAGGAELFMTKGAVVGVQGGTIESFEGSGTAYEAPSPALPLLTVMQAQSDEVRQKYYTEKTSISAVDETLSEGGFTGFVVLSENVLSGEYYLVYHAGRSMSVAFLGESERLLTGDEAFETAADEVGLYEVRPVEIEPIEIPEPDPDTEPAPESDADRASDSGPAEDAESALDGPDPDPGADPEAATDAAREQPSEPAAAGPDETGPSRSTEDGSPDRGAGTGPDARSETATGERSPNAAEPARNPDEPDRSRSGSVETGDRRQAPSDGGSRSGTASETASREQERASLETVAVPSLDPSRTRVQSRTQSRSRADGSAGTTSAEQASEASPASEPSEDAGPDPERVAELEAAVGDREEEIDRLNSELAEATDERAELRDQLETVTEERDALIQEVERLEDDLATLESELGAQVDAERRLSAREALAGTDLFVRYDSKGDTPLAKAHDGAGRRSDVVENLRLETYTQFESEAVAVGGKEYDAFLTDTAAYQFANWLIRDLLFEIRSTGSEAALRTLYDMLPEIDRVEFAGTVEIEYTEDGQETRTDEEFDLVFRNRMGEPLIATNLNDSLEAASQAMMEQLITAARRVGQSSETFAGAFLVTTSFFEPGALETASEATKSGFLSRDKRASYVNLSRKRGFHLCLVEARDQKFNLAVPEL
ncbi:hypothetical protein BRC62_03720 [Halobacteriales archaeon QH_10_67_13]|nr:MAG: hypothetical protein BRC62_03720 [Halobacteriales archaeon QH_10_67_13]